MTKQIPPAPQTGRIPITLLPEQEKKLLRSTVKADRTDPFANDPDDAVRHLGKLALRRDGPDPTDSFALGDLCARLSLNDDYVLLVLYMGKTLLAYRRAGMQSTRDVDQQAADQACERFILWVLQVAQAYPTQRNSAAALWAAAEIPQRQQSAELRESVLPLLEQLAASYERALNPLAVSTEDPPSDSDPRATSEAPAIPSEPAFPPAAAEPLMRFTSAMTQNEPLILGSREAPQPDLLETRPDSPDTQDDNTSPFHASSLLNESNVLSASDPSVPAANPSPSQAPTVDPVEGSPIQPISSTPSEERERGDFQVGDVIGERFEVRQILRGGMGLIYLCYDPAEKDSVAIKTFQSRFLDNERAVARFTQEAYTWIRLEKHPNVVQARKVEHFGRDRNGKRPHIILEYIAGPEGIGSDLKNWIEHNRLDLPLTLEIALQICMGMQHATRMVEGLVHRDLKPANILVRHDGLAKVTDFGLVRSLETRDQDQAEASPDQPGEAPSRSHRLTRAGAVVGTAPYMSPEQSNRQDVDLRSDIYAFGVILFEMLTRRPLFRARTFDDWIDAHTNHAPEFPSELIGRIPRDIQVLTLRCLAKPVESRPANWTELIDALSALYETITGQSSKVALNYPAGGDQLEARELMDKAYSLTELGYAGESLAAYDRALALDPTSAWIWGRKGRTLRILERYSEALDCFNKSLALDPAYVWAWNHQGIVYERLGQYEDALKSYQQASALRPLDIYAMHNQVKILSELGRHEEALTKLDQAISSDPNDAESQALRGRLFLALKRNQESLEAYDRAVTLDPGHGWAWYGKGMALRALDRLSEAASAFMQATRLLPSQFRPWDLLAQTLIDLRQFNEALPVVEQATRNDPGQVGGWDRKGQILRHLRRFAEALEAYDRALALEPNNGWALSGKGVVFERLDLPNEALDHYKRAAEQQPDNAWNVYNQGNLLIKMQRFDEAVATLRQATKMDPGHIQSWAKLGIALAKMDKHGRAIVYLDHALRLNEDYGLAWNAMGISLEALGRYEDALTAYFRACACAPDDLIYHYNWADLLIKRELYEEAIPVMREILRLAPNHSRRWASLGQLYRFLGRFEEALDAYDHAIQIDPKYSWAWNGKGLALGGLDRHEEALKAFQRAAEENPDEVWHWVNQAEELHVLARYEEALERLDQALQIDEAHAISWGKRGQVLRRLGRYREAVASYDQAISFDPNYGWAWSGRGLAFEQMDRVEDALASYEKAAEADPDNLWYWMNQLDLLLKMNQLEDALDVCGKMLQALPMESTAWARKGQLLRRLDRHKEAINAYKQAVEIDPNYAWAWNGLGLAYDALGRWADALPCFEKATEADSLDVWFWHNRGEALFELGRYTEAWQIMNRALEVDPRHDPSRQIRTEARKKLEENDKGKEE